MGDIASFIGTRFSKSIHISGNIFKVAEMGLSET
jgi:hypothetical protein